jgi:hypothetical protein
MNYSLCFLMNYSLCFLMSYSLCFLANFRPNQATYCYLQRDSGSTAGCER